MVFYGNDFFGIMLVVVFNFIDEIVIEFNFVFVFNNVKFFFFVG